MSSDPPDIMNPLYNTNQQETITAAAPQGKRTKPNAIAWANKEFVDLSKAAPALRLDSAYGTTDNFIGKQILPDGRIFVTKPTGARLLQANASLYPFGFGITVHDGLRPVAAQRVLYAHHPYSDDVANPDDGEGSQHSYGMTVDVSLHCRRSGKRITMPTEYDAFGPRAHWNYQDLPGHIRRRRHLLYLAMTKAGFVPNPLEWWHWTSVDHFAFTPEPVLDFSLWNPHLVAA